MGLMTMSQDGEPPRQQLLDTVTAALEAGVTLFDTADAYGQGTAGEQAMGQNERLIAGLLDELGVRSEVVLATKAGHTRGGDGSWGLDSRPEYLREAAEASLARLGVERSSCGSTTARARSATTAPPWRPCARSRTPGSSRWSASPTRTRSRSAPPTTCWATGS